jgi:hypothetical protein
MSAAVEVAITGDVVVAGTLDGGMPSVGAYAAGEVSITGSLEGRTPALSTDALGAVIVTGTLGTPPPPPPVSLTLPKATVSISGTVGSGTWVPPAPITVGSAPVGSAAYTIPSSGQVLYASPSGSNSNPGTEASPKLTLAGAISAVSASFGAATIVLRAGTYHESLTVSKAVTIQAYPNEAVWLDGSSVYPTWAGSGPWTAPLGPDWNPVDSTRYAYSDPTAVLPEQAWVDGVMLKQLADGATPGVGQFSVNRSAQTITIGTNPAGAEVRVTDLNHALVFTVPCGLYGVGVRRYSPLVVEGISAMLYFGGTSQGSVIENCVLQESGMTGIATARQIVLRNVTVQDCNQSGIQATTADDLIIDRFVVRRCNRGLWQMEPITAGIKITKSERTMITNGLISDVPGGGGLWWDTFCPRLYAANIAVDGTTVVPGAAVIRVGIMPEGADGGYFDGQQYRGWIVNCRVTNTRTPIKILDAGWITIANCEVDIYSLVGMYLQQDDRRNDGSKASSEGTIEESPWLTLHNSLLNNDINPGSGSSVAQVIAYQDPVAWTPAQLGWDAFDRVAGNWFRPVPPGSMVQLGKADGYRVSYNTLEALATSPSTVGGPPGDKLGVNHQGSTAPDHDIAEALPAWLYTRLGLPNGLKRVGPFLPSPVASF